MTWLPAQSLVFSLTFASGSCERLDTYMYAYPPAKIRYSEHAITIKYDAAVSSYSTVVTMALIHGRQ